MDIEIRKLTPDLAEAYARFFDETSHNEEGGGIKCYCVSFRGDESLLGDDHWYPTPEERRERAIEFVKAGSLQGYLACCEGEIVGWCNATADCKKGVEYLRSIYPIGEHPAGVKVKSIFCFMIAPDMRRKGVATALLERVCEDAANDGFDFAEAYINMNAKSPAMEHMGPLAMYEKCGFVKHAKRKSRVVMRKALK